MCSGALFTIFLVILVLSQWKGRKERLVFLCDPSIGLVAVFSETIFAVVWSYRADGRVAMKDRVQESPVYGFSFISRKWIDCYGRLGAV